MTLLNSDSRRTGSTFISSVYPALDSRYRVPNDTDHMFIILPAPVTENPAAPFKVYWAQL